MVAKPGFKRSAHVSTPKVEIYTKWGCPYCVRAKALLKEKGVDFAEYDITLGGPKKAEMRERAPGAMTVPQIFIDDQAIGGCDDMQALERAGKLDPLLGL
ncbi:MULTISPECIES: glutaredoxin 3 [unclassified Novosphingobium]|uniref:glutaredoxin 3 n=1 Tax=unclassified Novosphingobium TaxID=2644732 RepID=UPI0025D73300|nr:MULTISPECIES: glutaredoxin 3 [unclassified Novosphingobium]HQV02674.1 glutaredoxin 3 [Novosphingobium sp.]